MPRKSMRKKQSLAIGNCAGPLRLRFLTAKTRRSLNIFFFLLTIFIRTAVKKLLKMVRAWYMDTSDADQRMEHHREPPEFLSLKELYAVSGVEYFKINARNWAADNVLRELKEKRGYSYEDEIVCSKECLPNYEEKLKNFFTEHLHTDEEIRLVLAGSGYFDVRDKNDEWIRIEVTAGDLIIIPSGIYHRFTLDVNNYIKAKRYFVGEPVWLPYNRPADQMEARQRYLDRLKNDFRVEVK